VVVILSQAHATPARAWAPDTVSHQLITRFSSAFAAAHASIAAGRAGGFITRRLGSIDAERDVINDGSELASDPSYPASDGDGNILGVAATTAQDTLASFSNYYPRAVDLAAPGDATGGRLNLQRVLGGGS
jgi:hypothetical protein